MTPLAWLGLVLGANVLGCPGPDVPDDTAPRVDGFTLDRAAVDGASPDVPELDATGSEATDAASTDRDSGDPATVDGGVSAGGSLRFFGYGRDAVDRVVIPLDGPPRPVDIGERDFTVELFVRMRPGDNPSTGCRAVADGWIDGHALLDRDVYGAGDEGDYGLSILDGIVAFGLTRGDSGIGLCARTRIDDDRWHHVAVTREGTSGRVRLFVDGTREAEAVGPTGDLRYRDARSTAYPYDPALVLGAEKHDAGAAYPSFSGWLDELRLSTVVRYDAAFAVPVAPFAPDVSTAALYHCDEGAGTSLTDATGGGSEGQLRVGGEPLGPAWAPETPF